MICVPCTSPPRLWKHPPKNKQVVDTQKLSVVTTPSDPQEFSHWVGPMCEFQNYTDPSGETSGNHTISPYENSFSETSIALSSE